MAKCSALKDRAARLFERASEADMLANGVFIDAAGEVFAKVEMAADGVEVHIVDKKPILDWDDIGRFEAWLKQVRKLQWSK